MRHTSTYFAAAILTLFAVVPTAEAFERGHRGGPGHHARTSFDRPGVLGPNRHVPGYGGRRHHYGAFPLAPFATADRVSYTQPPPIIYEQPSDITITYGVPTVMGIRAAPVGQPVVYVIDQPRRTSSRRPAIRVVRGSQAAGDGEVIPAARPDGETGPRIVRLTVPARR